MPLPASDAEAAAPELPVLNLRMTAGENGELAELRLGQQGFQGEDRFALAADGHRLIGLNSMLLGSGMDAEAEQAVWLDQQLVGADAAGGDRTVAGAVHVGVDVGVPPHVQRAARARADERPGTGAVILCGLCFGMFRFRVWGFEFRGLRGLCL